MGIGIGTRTGSMKSMKSTNATCILTAPGQGGAATRSTLLISGDIVVNNFIFKTSNCLYTFKKFKNMYVLKKNSESIKKFFLSCFFYLQLGIKISQFVKKLF